MKNKENSQTSGTPPLINLLRIILKSQEVKNLDFVANKIVSLAKESNFNTKGPKFMPNKVLRVTPRSSPNGNGKSIFNSQELTPMINSNLEFILELLILYAHHTLLLNLLALKLNQVSILTSKSGNS